MRRVVATAVLVVLTWSVGVLAAAPDGTEILAQTTAVMRSDSRVMDLEMVLENSRGQQRSRTVKVWAKSENLEDKMLLQFLEPRDVAGTGFLVLGDDMWLYLPALKQTRRIAGHAKSGNFMGSDLSYEDMEEIISTGFTGYEARWLETERKGGENAHRLQLRPTSDSSYDFLEMWVSVETFLPRQIDYYIDGQLGKSLVTEDFTTVEGRWTPTRIVVTDHRQNTRTRLNMNNVTFSEVIDDTLFSVRHLERGVQQ